MTRFRFLHSIRWRVQAWHALMLLMALGVLWITAYQLAWDNQVRRIDKELASAERGLIRAFMQAPPPPGQVSPQEQAPPRPSDFLDRLRAATLPEEVAARYRDREPGYAYFALHDREGKVIQRSENCPEEPGLLPVPDADMVEESRLNGNRREYLRSSSHGLRGVVGRDITPEIEEMHRFLWLLSLFCGGIWVLGLAGGWWLAGRAIAPIQSISQTASRIAEGNLEERIDTRGTDSELDQLSRVLNGTFERLHDAFERQRQFTADASHELRTPVTILLMETQRVLKRPRTGEEYQEALRTCRETAGRMRRLIEALLLLARQGSGGAGSAVPESVDLHLLLADTARQLAPVAAEKGLTIHSEGLRPAACLGLPDALSIVATNLLMNAIQHHREGGRIELGSLVRGGEAVFIVSDDGPGISGADLPHIFERFYRADKARTGDGSHTGLGLAVVKMLVTEMGGTVSVESREGQGAAFEVRLPLGPGRTPLREPEEPSRPPKRSVAV